MPHSPTSTSKTPPSHLSRRWFLRASTLAAAAGAVPWRPARAATPLRMACWSQPLSEQTNVFAAQEQGWFREAGLEFTFVPGAGGGGAVKQVLAGNAEMAFANLEPLFFAADKGEALKAVYNIYPQNVFNVVSRVEKNITKPQDLKGKRLGVYSMESGTRHNLRIILHSVGLEEKDVELIPTGLLNFGPLIQDQVDATAATDTGLWAAQQSGLGAVNILWARDYLNTPTDAFIVTESWYAAHRNTLRAFLQAYKRGTQWMLDRPDEAAQLAVKHAIDGKDVQRNLEIIKLRNASTVNADTAKHGLGWFDLALLERVERTFRALGLTQNQLDVHRLFTNDIVQTL